MQPVIYDVAVSIDGFISAANNDVSQFPFEGEIVDDYRQRLTGYSHCLMGRKTYEFGYAYGLKPGDNPYPGMVSIVCSKTINLPQDADVKTVCADLSGFVNKLKRQATGPIYLCGGGDLAGWMAKNALIDQLAIKRAPILLGNGIPVFGRYSDTIRLSHISSKPYQNGQVFQRYSITR